MQNNVGKQHTLTTK